VKTILAIIILSVAGFASTTVTSITCSGQTATVNSTAHGLVASQGFSLSGTSATFNSTASSITPNAFTFLLPTGTSCSGFTSGYTSVQAAKQIIKISSTLNPLAGTVTISYLEWFTTSLPNPCTANCPLGSTWPNSSAAENAAIVAGTTVEVYGQLTLPANTSAASAQTSVQSQYSTMQAAFANFLTAGNGYWFNGTTWVNQ
jgi:hypothetical protein